MSSAKAIKQACCNNSIVALLSLHIDRNQKSKFVMIRIDEKTTDSMVEIAVPIPEVFIKVSAKKFLKLISELESNENMTEEQFLAIIESYGYLYGNRDGLMKKHIHVLLVCENRLNRVSDSINMLRSSYGLSTM
jgi:hypothetical protein